MPYKDPTHKREWELRHRPRRLARRRAQRRMEAARKTARPPTSEVPDTSASFLFPLIAGGALAAYSPKLAIGAGGLTLLAAALYKRDSSWWIVGVLILALGLFFQWTNQSANKTK